MVYVALAVIAAAGIAFTIYYRSKYLVVRENISCLELLKQILNAESSLERNILDAINTILKEYFKADSSILANIESGIVVKASSGPVDGIDYIAKYKEYNEAIEKKEIRMVKLEGESFYTAAAKRRSQAIILVPLIGKGNVSYLWILEYKSTRKKINFIHMYIVAKSLFMPLHNAELTGYIQRMAFFDNLTEVRNRNGMYQYLNKAVAKAKMEGESLVFSIFDIDHFKKFNDTYGHKAGDFILKELAQYIQKLLQPKDLIARWGGEEFVICIPGVSLKEGMESIERIRLEVNRRTFVDHGREFNITCSFGITQYREDDTVDVCFKRADKALYVAKEGGRNRIETA